MIDRIAEAIAGYGWAAMSAAERDQVRIVVKRVAAALMAVDRKMAIAGLTVRQDTRMRFETDEARVIAEFRAMLAAATESVA